jgi:peptide-methionine (R)-S-oxide reductase
MTMKFDRRTAIGAGAAGLLGGLGLLWGGRRGEAAPGRYEIMLSDAEWRKRLSPQAYAVLRKASTERAGSSPLDKEKRKGTFLCGGCSLPVYSSAAKYESGTGWPSFFKPLPSAIGTREDDTLFARRTEVHCRRCGGHLGHVFDDGPPPTGKRYCMNGAAMKFVPA